MHLSGFCKPPRAGNDVEQTFVNVGLTFEVISGRKEVLKWDVHCSLVEEAQTSWATLVSEGRKGKNTLTEAQIPLILWEQFSVMIDLPPFFFFCYYFTLHFCLASSLPFSRLLMLKGNYIKKKSGFFLPKLKSYWHFYRTSSSDVFFCNLDHVWPHIF